MEQFGMRGLITKIHTSTTTVRVQFVKIDMHEMLCQQRATFYASSNNQQNRYAGFDFDIHSKFSWEVYGCRSPESIRSSYLVNSACHFRFTFKPFWQLVKFPIVGDDNDKRARMDYQYSIQLLTVSTWHVRIFVGGLLQVAKPSRQLSK